MAEGVAKLLKLLNDFCRPFIYNINADIGINQIFHPAPFSLVGFLVDFVLS